MTNEYYENQENQENSGQNVIRRTVGSNEIRISDGSGESRITDDSDESGEYHKSDENTSRQTDSERSIINDAHGAAGARHTPDSTGKTANRIFVNDFSRNGLSKGEIRRRRIRRRNQDMAIRIALIFFTGFLCGSLFTGLFLRPQAIPASAVANNPEENSAAYDETAEPETPDADQPPLGVVVIDAGHGGKDPGCMESSVWESELNLQMALKLQEKLEAKGVQVLMTRTDDEVTLSLAERAELANDHKADVFVSIHQNSYTSPQISGIEFFYKEGEPGSEALAGLFEENIQSDGSISSRGIKASGDLKVLRLSKGPAVLIESGYLTNPAEEKNLLSDSYQDKLMGYIADGIIKFLEQEAQREA